MTTNRSLDYVRYASYMFIDRYGRVKGKPPSGVLYNKFMILLNRELKDKLGTDMRLPHCWYRWGDEVVRYNMPYLTWNHDDPRQTTVMFSGSTLIPVDQDEIIRYTGSYADVFIARYGGNGGVDLAIEEVYSGAPFEFQNDYRALRENLKEVKSNVPISNYVEFVRGLYNKAMSGYPITSFQSTKVQVEQFRKVFEKAMDEGLSVNRLQQISEAFWLYFCYHLRLHRSCHENVSKETIAIWRSALPEALEVFEEKMQNYAYYLFPDGSDDSLINEMLENRRRRLDELRSIMMEMDCGEDSRV